MHKRYELTGKIFGKLTVLSFAGVGDDYTTRWVVRCECGTEKTVIGKNLVKGLTKSCGCKQGGRSDWHRTRLRFLAGAVYRSHGMSDTPLYASWIAMKMRCYNPNNQDYRNYGGRGIRVCNEWRDSFEAFFRDMEPTWQRGLTLDRIDSNGNYEPSNCRWVPMSEQGKTRRTHAAREFR